MFASLDAIFPCVSKKLASNLERHLFLENIDRSSNFSNFRKSAVFSSAQTSRPSPDEPTQRRRRVDSAQTGRLRSDGSTQPRRVDPALTSRLGRHWRCYWWQSQRSPGGYLHDVLETFHPPSIRPSGICLQAWHASRKHNFSDFAKRATKVALLRRGLQAVV